MFLDVRNVRNESVPDGKVIIYWLCGVGFVFKFPNRKIICIDPYLSDSCENLSNGEFRRITAAPIKADELIYDVLLMSHEHGDHMDIDSFDDYLSTNPDGEIFAPECCDEFLKSKNAAYEQIKAGSVITIDDIKIETLDADHSDLSPDAVGFIITFGERTIYFTGDTCLNEPMLKPAIESKPEIIIPCINGAYGNLDEKDAAILTGLCGSDMVIASHFGLFIEHGGCPRRFSQYLKEESPNTKQIVITPGRGIIC